MRILFVTHRFPFEEVMHAGGVYLCEVVKALKSRGVTVDILTFLEAEELHHVDGMRKYFDNIDFVCSTKRKFEKILDLPSLFFKPRFVVDAYQREFKRKFLQLQDKNRYDIIQFEWTVMSQYIKFVKGNAKVTLTEHDVVSLPIEREYSQAKEYITKIKKLVTLKLTQRFEIRQCLKADMVFTLSDKDNYYLKSVSTNIKTHQYPLYIEKPSQLSRPAPLNRNILFVGHLGRYLNVKAVEWFYYEVFKDLLKIYEDVSFIIVGADPDSCILELSRNKNVHLYADVADVKEYYLGARVFISPLTVGGGVIKKNLDSMALGCPLITTSVGNEGINAIDNESVLIANSKQEYIEKLMLILSDDKHWERLSDNSIKFVMDKYDFENSVDKLVFVYNSLMSGN